MAERPICTFGSSLSIVAYKYDGAIHRRWEPSRVIDPDGPVLWLDPGTQVIEANGKRWEDAHPVVFHFWPDAWFNVAALLRPNGVGFYCNLGLPPRMDAERISFVDLDVDLVLRADLSWEIVDWDEFEDHRQEMHYPPKVKTGVQKGLERLLEMVERRQGPFRPEAADTWEALRAKLDNG